MAAWSPSASKAHARRERVSARALTAVIGREALPILACCTLTGLGVATLRHVFATDGWLALTAGRLVAQHGLPHHDTLTVVAKGRTWIDQQWLAQLALYGMDRVGGVRLVLAVNLTLVVSAFVAAVVFSRRRGGRPGMVAVVALAAIVPYLIAAAAVRPQSFAYLPFVLLLWALSAPKIDWTRIFLVLTALAVWSNVHGSVLLAAALVVLRGAFDLAASARAGRFDSRAVVLTFAPFAYLFVSPYGFSLASYYHSTAFNPAFTRYLDFWSPTKPSAYTLPLYALLLTAVWLIGRVRRSYSTYETALLLVAVALGLLALRNWPFATLIVLMFVPAGLGEVFSPRRAAAPALAAALGLVTIVATIAGATVVLTRQQATFTRGFAPRAAAVVANAAAADPNAVVYSTERFADWLLWQQPQLAGRIRTDARYELLSAPELEQVTLFRFGAGVDRALRPREIFVLDPDSDRRAIEALRPRLRILYSTPAALIGTVRPS